MQVSSLSLRGLSAAYVIGETSVMESLNSRKSIPSLKVSLAYQLQQFQRV